MKKIIVLSAFCVVVLNLYAQRATGEQPYGLMDGFRAQPQAITVLQTPDIARIVEEDLEKDTHPGPSRYACAMPVSFTTENSGNWQQLDDGSKIWRLKVSAPDALATITYYDRFWLPEGAKFFVYSEDTRQTIGAIIPEFIEGSREKPLGFATAEIYGENVVYEYYQPASVKEPPVIHINRIDYAYRNVNNPYNNGGRGLGKASPCNININCQEGCNWQMEKHAIVRVTIPIEIFTFTFSGALVNNTANDYTPYVLIADHCLLDESGVFGNYEFEAQDNYIISGILFYWNFEDEGCSDNLIPPPQLTSQGAIVVANNAVSDFALLKIFSGAQDPRNITGVTPYYLGWDRSSVNSFSEGVGIHHPRGDVKKISHTNQIQSFAGLTYKANGTYICPPHSYWHTNFYSGFIEPGSNGSPLINNDGRVIGQLFGGYAAQPCDPNHSMSYGRFSMSWTGNNANDNRERLDVWLHPNPNIPAPTTLDGIGYNVPMSYICGQDVICNNGGAFETINPPPGTIYWNLTGPFSFSSSSIQNTTTGNPVNVYWTGAGNGAGILTARIGSIYGPIIEEKTIIPCQVEINGPQKLCAIQYQIYHVTVSNAPPGYTWLSSSNVVVHSIYGNTLEFELSPNTGYGYAMFYIKHGSTVLASHVITVIDPPDIDRIEGDEVVTNASSYYVVLTGGSEPMQYQWHVTAYDGVAYLTGNGYPYVNVGFQHYNNYACYYLDLYVTNECGEDHGWIGIVAGRGGSSLYSYYPNPVSDILYIEIDKQAIDNVKVKAQGIAGNTDPVFDLRLYDLQGKLLQQQFTKGGSVQFNVSKLLDGVYYLHIYDGVSDKPEMFQIVVLH